jgi:putative NADH-flavin reductase
VHLTLVRMAGDDRKGSRMKIVVIGGSGLIGTKLVNMLRERGHEALAASPSSGVNTLTGVGLAEALAGAAVVVDVTNSPSFEDAVVSLDSVYGSKRSFGAHLADGGVQRGMSQRVSTMWKGTFSARYGRA